MQADYYLLWLVLRMKVCKKVGPIADPSSPYRHQSASILAIVSHSRECAATYHATSVWTPTHPPGKRLDRGDVKTRRTREPLFVLSISPQLTLSLSDMPQYFGSYSLSPIVKGVDVSLIIS